MINTKYMLTIALDFKDEKNKKNWGHSGKVIKYSTSLRQTPTCFP